MPVTVEHDTQKPVHPIAVALRDEIVRLAGDGEFTSKTLSAILRVASTGQKVLQAMDPQIPTAAPRNALSGIFPNPGVGPVDGMGIGEGDGDGYQTVGVAQAAETFGSNVMRQLMDALPKLIGDQRMTPEKLVSAIADARRFGMTDVAAGLEKKLLGSALDGSRPVSDPVVVPASRAFPPIVTPEDIDAEFDDHPGDDADCIDQPEPLAKNGGTP